MTDFFPAERRRLERIRCTRKPLRQSGILFSGKRSFSVSLIDLHIRGARLRFMDLSSAAAVGVGDACRFNLRIKSPAMECDQLDCCIAWKMGADLGLSFKALLGVSQDVIAGLQG